MIDAASLRKHIRFTIEHYGTRTKGEEHRMDQVADYLTELVTRIQSYDAALNETSKNYPDNIAATFSLHIG